MKDSNIIIGEGFAEIPDVKSRPRLPWHALDQPGRFFIIPGVTKRRAVPVPPKHGFKVATVLVPEGLKVIRLAVPVS